MATVNQASSTNDAINNTAVPFTGIGSETKPYTTSDTVKYTMLQMTVTFYTQHGKENASYTLGRVDGSVDISTKTGNLQNDLLAFQTSYDGTQDVPTSVFTLNGMRDWEDILIINDYMELGVQTWASDGSSNQATIMTGLISDITKTLNPASTGRSYTVTCQGVQKILNNVNLTTFTELMGDEAYLIYDINGAGDGSSSSSGSDSSSETTKDKAKDLKESATGSGTITSVFKNTDITGRDSTKKKKATKGGKEVKIEINTGI